MLSILMNIKSKNYEFYIKQQLKRKAEDSALD